ncbi:L-lactate permease [Geobacter sulfurreducens]|uniref:L-lactate permease n=1 Tax=Geobacter sulfurreducens (strain ATCC 51573 / DSM 12127 / PCA) TaxID=243231 RepID=Q74GM0_GEOSL|nr:L-lactate permease [Geobacter sulfurreducens]AAR33560.1 membrane protein, putative [Geobacter sulfurreducens PCA]UAC04322.1 L-lactate permease [Geobacter sulfurreducens]HBB68808.1 L-lactate permease [Geobacter sulfurreducens]HCD96925.1 L-lactate permease [Geobacter sulfurreducens]
MLLEVIPLTLPLLLTLLPIVVILVMLLVFRKAADVSGIIGWLAISVVAWLGFQTAPEVILRSTAAGFIRSFSVSLIVATSLLQMALMEKTGALRRITIFIRTIASDNRAVQIMMINIGFGTLMVAVGATPVSILPPILLAMGYSTYVAIALPAIGYDSLCTYALLGAPIVVFVDIANSFLGKGNEIALHQAGMVFYMFLPVVSTMIGFCMLWIVGKWQAIRDGWLPCLLTGAVIGVVARFTNQYDNLVVLTGVLCGIAVIAAMAAYLVVTGGKVIDRSLLSAEEREFAAAMPLWRAFMPWTLLVILILVLNVPQDLFSWLYRTMKLPIAGLTADGKPLDTRALWQAYTWILVSTILAVPFLKPTGEQLRETVRTWVRRAPRPVFAAAVFFAIGEIMNMAGYDMAAGRFVVPSMVTVLADSSALAFQGMYGEVVAFIGLFGGFITGSEASTIAMFAKYTMTTAKNLDMPLSGLIIVTAGLAFGGGLASVISPAKLQNAAAAIDRIGEEGKVIRIAFVFALLLTLVTSLFVVVLLTVNGMGRVS